MYHTIKTQATRFLSQEFFRHNLVFFLGTLLISIFNYLYYPVISRLVSVTDFGEIQAIISIFTQLGILLTAFGYVVTNIVNNSTKQKADERILLSLERMMLVVSLFLFVGIIGFGHILETNLRFSSVIPLILVGVLVVMNIPTTARTYFLQGIRHMGQVSISGILFAASKLILSVVLIMLGNSVVAVMVAYIIAHLLTLMYLWLKTHNLYPGLRASLSVHHLLSTDKKLLKEEVVYGAAILVLLSGVTFLYTSDAILVRLFATPEDAGLYSGISAIGRIVFFITASVAGVLIATVKMTDNAEKNIRVLKKSFLLVTGIGGLVALLFSLAPSLFISILLGKDYSVMAHLLPYVSLMMLLCSYNNLLVSYQIALRRFRAILTVAAGIILFVTMLWIWHDSLMAIVMAYLMSNAFIGVLLLMQIMKGKQYA